MKSKKSFVKLLFYFGGLIIMTFGVSLSVKSNLGVSPISSIPYSITLVSGMDLGLTTIIFSVVVVLLQIILLRKKYKIINLLQIPIGAVFGAFLTVFGNAMGFFPSPEGFILKFLLMLVSTVFVALGVFLYVPAGFVPLPPEGVLLAVTQVSKIKFSTAKVAGDVIMVLISLLICLVKIHSFGSVGIGTVAAALLVGTEVRWMTQLWGSARDKMLSKNPAKVKSSEKAA